MEEHDEKAAPSGDDASETEGEACAVCGQVNPPGADVCSKCGQRLLPTKVQYHSREEAFGVERPPIPPLRDSIGETRVKPVDDAPPSKPETPTTQTGPSVEGQAQKLEDSEFKYFFAPPQGTMLLQPAGLIRRAGALIIDWLIAVMISVIVLYVAGAGEQLVELASVFSMENFGALELDKLSAQLYSVYLATALLNVIVPVGMYTVLTYYGGSTLGMRLFGIQVTRIDGADLSLWIAFLRAAVLWLFILFAWVVYLPLAALYTYLDPRGRTIHDVLCGTNVYIRSPGG